VSGPLNIVIPMAGLGSRFSKAGYSIPKPLIPVGGIPMVRLVIENTRPRRQHRYIFICQRRHVEAYALAPLLEAAAPGCDIVQLDGLTEGAACTVLAARERLDPDAPLMIANSDQWVDVAMEDYLATMDANGADGLIMTMRASDPKWSFVALQDGWVTRVVEKDPISDEATVGIYNFRRAGDFIGAAEDMIARNERVNNEFYVAPVYNSLIRAGKRIAVHNIGEVGAGMYGIGIPEDLDEFLRLPVSRKAIASVA
jgi:NDP-sugar pyrophosphorylase family protein